MARPTIDAERTAERRIWLGPWRLASDGWWERDYLDRGHPVCRLIPSTTRTARIHDAWDGTHMFSRPLVAAPR